MKISVTALVVLFCSASALAAGDKVFFISPKNNAIVTSPFKVKMGVKGVKVCVANIESKDPKCGHHHILVDSAFVPEGQPVPKNETHIHFGKEETTAELRLVPGTHTLTLQFANYAHISMGEKLSATITVTVK